MGTTRGREHFLSDRDLDPADFRRLVAHRHRACTGEKTPLPTDEDERKRLEGHLEKIHRTADFLPASFLRDGAERARAVCRIQTPTSLGTGFLVAPGYLMTNNHVLEDRDTAAGSVAEFGYEDGGDTVTVSVHPERLFVTDAELDFTIVACGTTGIEDLPSIPLRRTPASVTRYERVSVIQHPSGRPKEVALHDNKVERVQSRVVRYRTDTEPGSSGSPVFNSDWELVALHHAGFKEPGGKAQNEGIRASAIVSHLLGSESASLGGGGLEALLGAAGTSPYLGFFDGVGVGARGPGPLEVEVPDWGGDKQFADVGFWNIEHFNARISEERLADVAAAVAGLSMDALGLTEVQVDAMRRLVAKLAGQGLDYRFELFDVWGGQDLAVLYDADTTSVRARGDLTAQFADQLDAETSGGKRAFPRKPGFAHVIVDEGDGQVEFLMIIVHLKAFGDAVSRERRRLASEKLAEIIAAVRDEHGLPVVLGGDFNEELRTGVLSALTDAPDLVALTTNDDADGAISYVGGSHRSLIDHILVSSDVRLGDIQGDDAAIVRLDRSVRDFADRVSDHVPVVMRMVYRDEPIDVRVDLVDGIVDLDVPRRANEVRLHFDRSG